MTLWHTRSIEQQFLFFIQEVLSQQTHAALWVHLPHLSPWELWSNPTHEQLDSVHLKAFVQSLKCCLWTLSCSDGCDVDWHLCPASLVLCLLWESCTKCQHSFSYLGSGILPRDTLTCGLEELGIGAPPCNNVCWSCVWCWYLTLFYWFYPTCTFHQSKVVNKQQTKRIISGRLSVSDPNKLPGHWYEAEAGHWIHEPGMSALQPDNTTLSLEFSKPLQRSRSLCLNGGVLIFCTPK